MISSTYPVKGMHCASCAGIIEKTLAKVEGVHAVEVNIVTEAAKITFDDARISPEELSQKIEPLGYTLVIQQTASEMGMSTDEHAMHLGLGQSKHEKLAELATMRSMLFSILPLAVFSILMMGWDMLLTIQERTAPNVVLKEFFHHLLPIFATYALFVVGKPYLLGVYRFMRYGKANMDTLIGIGTLAAFLFSFTLSAFEEPLRAFINVDQMYYDVTIVVIAFITLGKYLEARSKLKTGDAIEALLNLQAKTAIVIRDGEQKELPLQEVVVGDVLALKPGSHVPVDGVVTEGSTFVDESMITGEPMPVEKRVGDTVIAGTMNTTGSVLFRATKVGADTLLAQMIKMVEEAQGSRAPIQGLADKISSVFVPIVLVIACVSLFGWLLFGTASLGFSQALSFGLVSFVSVLVIACPCALGLATPTAIIVGVGKGAQEGILVKDAATLEKLHHATVVVVDKTGTLTKGKPELVVFQVMDAQEESVALSILASLETLSEHPIAHAILTYAKEQKASLREVREFELLEGKGVKGSMDGKMYYAGNATLMKEQAITFDEAMVEKATLAGGTPVFLASDHTLLASVMVADALKPEAKQAVADLHAVGMKVVMLTGDSKNTAQAIASQVGVDEAVGEMLPQDKLAYIKQLQAKGEIVVMTGDGVNDAPALAQADVGIAMATGTDVAIQSAGIVLLRGDISKLVKAVHLSRLTMRGIKQNLFWAFVYNLVGIPLASGVLYPVFGWLLNPVFAGFAMALSSVSVVMNSLRLTRKKL